MSLAYATRLTATRDDSSAQLLHVANVVAQWAQIADPLRDADHEGRRGGHVVTEVLGGRTEDLWAWRLRLDHQDSFDKSVVWTVTVTCVRETHLEVSVRLDRTRTDGTLLPARGRPSPPGCIASLLEAADVRFEDAGRVLGTAVWVVEPSDAERFAEVVTHLDRRLPIFGLTLRDDDPIDGGMLLPQVLGLAHVALIKSATSWELNRLLPRGLNVYGGAARLWWPGVNQNSSRWDHNLWTADYSARQLEREAVEAIVDAGRTATSLDIRISQLERRKRDERTNDLVSQLKSLRAEAAETRRLEATSTSSPEASEVSEVDARVQEAEARALEALRTDRDDALALAVDHEQAAEETRERAGLAERERHYLRGEVARLRVLVDKGDSVDNNSDACLEQEIEYEVRVRGQVEGAMSRIFRFGSVFTINLEQHGSRYRSKVIKACADVVVGSPGLLGRRDDHPLRTGNGGNDPTRTRARDGAEARRCSIEKNTAAARRLHYWCIPDGSVEFASVNVHDDFAIPD